MLLSSWLRSLRYRFQLPAVPRRRPASRNQRKRIVLGVESLEDRMVLSTFTVTTTADNGDNTNPIAGSLCWAIQQVKDDQTDSTANPDSIAFNITAVSNAAGYPAGQATGYNATTGVAIIQPLNALPAITNPVDIDGYTQTGASQNTLTNGDNAAIKIELNGANVSGDDEFTTVGLAITANDCTVQGLAINSFAGSNLYVTGNGNHIQGNFIGTDASGTSTPFTPNLSQNGASDHVGIHVSGGSGNVIGTNGDGVNDPAERNIIAGNNYGVLLRTTSSSVVAGNFIGTDESGAHPLPNWIGIGTLLNANQDRIGTNGTDPDVAGERNIISGNAVGIAFGVGGFNTSAETNGTVAGNWIGLDVNGNALGNTRAGIFVGIESTDVTIGGSQANLANTIANTQGNGPGVWIVDFRGAPTGIQVQGNSIHDNGGLGIVLGGSFPTPPTTVLLNDSQGHVGPNNYQNFPVLNSAVSSSSDTSITGSFSEATESNTQITLDFYANSTADPSGYGEGQTYLGSTTFTTDSSGNASFSVDLGTGNLAGQSITATATAKIYDSVHNTYHHDTSEFAKDIQATAAPSGQIYDSTYLQTLLPQSSSTSNQLTIQTGTTLTQATVIAAVNGLTAPGQPVTIILNLNGGTYNDTIVSPPPNVTLVINGANNTTNTFVGHSPAFTITGGNVIVENVTFTTPTDAPTILVTGGNLMLRNDTIQESTGASDAAIAITGGTVDLGTTANPGGNVLNVNGSGEFIHNTTPNAVSAVGDTFEINGTPQTAAALSFTALASSAATSILNQPVTLTASVRGNGSSVGPTGTVDFFDTTTNTDLGSVALSGGVATLPTSALGPGNHVIVATYNGDATYLPSLDILTQTVHYNFSGFLPPLDSSQPLSIGQTVPIKFQLTDANGNAITSLSAVSSLQIQAVAPNGNAIGAPFDPTPAGGTSLSNNGGKYMFNWQTSGLSAGFYKIVLTLKDGTTQVKTVQLTSG